MSRRIEIPLFHGLKMVAETSGDPQYPMEMYIGVEDRNGAWIQDLAVVMKNYHYKPDGQVDYTDDSFRVLVYGDNKMDDRTDEITITLREDWDQ